MPTYAYVAPDGLPKGGGQNPDNVPDGAVVLTGDWLLSDLPRLMLVDGTWTTRPTLPGPAVDGGDLWFDGLPDGASVTITNAITGATVATPSTWVGGVAVTLPKGSYLVQITAPNPWLDHESLIEVDGGDPQRDLDALDNAKLAARVRVNEKAGQARLALVTDIPGQQAIYQAKENEARAYLAAGAPDDLTDYPAIAAEIGITAPTAYALAQTWLNMAALFRWAAAASERARLTALAAVDAATSIEALEAVLHPPTDGELP